MRRDHPAVVGELERLASVADASYVALRFVELGGDHLEALVNDPPPAASSLLLAALENYIRASRLVSYAFLMLSNPKP